MIAANARGRKGAAMPVIGRLDRQVDEVIISPVSERRRGGAPPERDEDAPGPPPSPTTQTPAPPESSADRDELPVWLL
jgi:hypothetical protein